MTSHRPRGRRRARSSPAKLAGALVLAAALALLGAQSASAHAQLLGTSPTSGATVPAQPKEVIFEFNQNVGGTLGAVRVYDAQGNEVDDLDVSHPDGQEHWMGVGLKPGLPDGTYTATYRVISADTHIVYGGLVFNIGHPGAAPKFTVAGLIERNKSGEVTILAFGAVRALDYLTIALLIGGLAFLLFVWRPAFAAVVGEGPEWDASSREFARRMRRLLAVAVALGFLVSVLGVLLQGASAAGVSLWSSLKGAVLESTLQSRFGEVWGLRALDWLALGALLSAAGSPLRRAAPRVPADCAPADRAPAAAGGSAVAAELPPPWLLAPLALGAAYLAATPALSGHASIQSPTAVFFPSDVLHVLAASLWVGGIACLLFALPAATRRLQGPDRTRLLLAALARVSPLALAAVVTIALTGVVQAYIDVRTLEALLHSTYGVLIIVKVILLLALIGLGWANRERVLPALQRIAAAGGAPGAAGVLVRRTLRSELTLMLVVFAVTAALISYAPPIDAATGPFSTNTTLGPAELELTVEPAKVGLNTIHLYLIDAKTGSQFTATKELVVKAELPAKGIGPLSLRAIPAGPGHYILGSAELSPGGTWEIQITDRVSEFEEFTRDVKVPIR
jgi:copper transport protein